MNCRPFFGLHPVVRQVLNNWPLYRASFSFSQTCIVGSHDNNLPVVSRDCPQPFWHGTSGNRTCFPGVVTSFWLLWWGWNCARNSGVEHVSCPEGCEMNVPLKKWNISCVCDCVCMFIEYCDFSTGSLYAQEERQNSLKGRLHFLKIKQCTFWGHASCFHRCWPGRLLSHSYFKNL